MTGKAYYLTTLADWQRHATRFANSHFIVLDSPAMPPDVAQVFRPEDCADHGAPKKRGLCLPEDDTRAATSSLGGQGFSPDITTRAERDSSGGRSFSSDINEVRAAPSLLPQAVAEAAPERHDSSVDANRDAATNILVLIEADEGVHLSLDDDPAFEALPHPLAQKPISNAAQKALAPHGVTPGATTFDAAEALARVHPLLRHRVF
jgi:hypothetical protein